MASQSLALLQNKETFTDFHGIQTPTFFIGSAKTDPVRFKWGFAEGLLNDEFAFFEAYKSPIPRRRKLLIKRPFLQAKRALFKNPFKLDRVSFSTLPYEAMLLGMGVVLNSLI